MQYYVSVCYFWLSHHDFTSLEHVNKTWICTNKAINWEKSMDVSLGIFLLAENGYMPAEQELMASFL